MGHLENHEHEYQTVRPYLTPYQMAKLIYKIQASDRFDIGELSHIHIRNTDVCVGYLGDESAEIVDPDRTETNSQRKHLKRYFNSV